MVVCIVLGNLAGVREWIDAANPPGDYDWFAPSRVVPGTINEFPWFSFLLGDLHAHVLALPFTALALGFVLQVALNGPRGGAVLRGMAEVLAAGLAIGALYAINSWSYPAVAGLLVLAIATWMRSPESAGRRVYAVVWLVLVLLASVVLILPFHLSFDPAARGIGWVGERRSFSSFAGDQALLYGLFAAPLAAAFAARVLATRRPVRTLVWSAVAALFGLSLLAPSDWAGVAALVALLAVALGALVSRRLAAPERFLWLLIAGGLICLIVPELVYVRDAFDHTDLYRMNTVFKLGYQAWVLLAVAAACALPWAGAWLPRRLWPAWAALTAVALLLGAVYPYAGTYARKGGFARSPSLDGLRWLTPSSPGDPAAIAWLRANTPGSAVVLEAVGEDYSAFGHARISTFTGRPTVLGWGGHELQWDHQPGTPRGRREGALHDHGPRHRARSDRPLRRRVRRVRPDRAHDLRRRRPGEVGRLGDQVFDRGRHHGLAAAATSAWCRATPACRRCRSTARAWSASARPSRVELAVVAHPPDPERELADRVPAELRPQPLVRGLGEDEGVRVGRACPAC